MRGRRRGAPCDSVVGCVTRQGTALRSEKRIMITMRRRATRPARRAGARQKRTASAHSCVLNADESRVCCIMCRLGAAPPWPCPGARPARPGRGRLASSPARHGARRVSRRVSRLAGPAGCVTSCRHRRRVDHCGVNKFINWQYCRVSRTENPRSDRDCTLTILVTMRCGSEHTRPACC